MQCKRMAIRCFSTEHSVRDLCYMEFATFLGNFPCQQYSVSCNWENCQFCEICARYMAQPKLSSIFLPLCRHSVGGPVVGIVHWMSTDISCNNKGTDNEVAWSQKLFHDTVLSVIKAFHIFADESITLYFHLLFGNQHNPSTRALLALSRGNTPEKNLQWLRYKGFFSKAWVLS